MLQKKKQRRKKEVNLLENTQYVIQINSLLSCAKSTSTTTIVVILMIREPLKWENEF
jgi:hypothetical protein